METTQGNQVIQKQRRSGIKFCIIESWKVFALNTKTFLKYLWIHLFIAGLGCALFTILCNKFYIEHIQPTIAYTRSGYDASLTKALFGPNISTYATLIVAFAAFLFANYLMYGALFSQIRFYKATDSLPVTGPLTFWKEIRKDGKKAFIFDLITALPLGAIVAVISLIAWLTSKWILLALIPSFIYWYIISINGRLQYVVENQPLKSAIKNAFTIGHHKFGGYLILLTLTSIPFFIVAYAAALPSTIIQLSYSADMISKLAGDPSGIPPYVLFIYIVTTTAGYALYNIAYSLQQWPLALYTSAFSQMKKNYRQK